MERPGACPHKYACQNHPDSSICRYFYYRTPLLPDDIHHRDIACLAAAWSVQHRADWSVRVRSILSFTERTVDFIEHANSLFPCILPVLRRRRHRRHWLSGVTASQILARARIPLIRRFFYTIMPDDGQGCHPGRYTAAPSAVSLRTARRWCIPPALRLQIPPCRLSFYYHWFLQIHFSFSCKCPLFRFTIRILPFFFRKILNILLWLS